MFNLACILRHDLQSLKIPIQQYALSCLEGSHAVHKNYNTVKKGGLNKDNLVSVNYFCNAFVTLWNFAVSLTSGPHRGNLNQPWQKVSLQKMIPHWTLKVVNYYYCPVTILKKFIQLMRHFRWSRSPWRRVDISRIARQEERSPLRFSRGF